MNYDTRPSTLTAVHNYNLRNQGWPTSLVCAAQDDGDKITGKTDPVTHTKNILNVYPSNADIINQSLLTTAKQVWAVGTYWPGNLEKNYFGNTPAPRGHFILNAFDRNRITVSGITNIYDAKRDKDTDRPVAVDFFAGRVFYFMPNGRVLFSQQLTDIGKAGNCYQENDPTAAEISDLLATDGGTIDIYEIGEILESAVMDRELVVFADNGVWAISGGASAAFTASDFEVRKITHIGSIGKESVVLAEDVIYYFGRGGIYRISRNQYTGLLESTNISETTIQTFYFEIPEIARRYTHGYYDQGSRKILWLYSDRDDYDGVNDRRRYTKALILDVITGAFSTYSFPEGTEHPYIVGLIRKEAVGTDIQQEDIVLGTDQIIVGTDDVVQDIRVPAFGDLRLKILTIVPTDTDEYRFTISEFRDRTFKDWLTFDDVGVDYDSYLETGVDILGDPIVVKFGNWLYAFFERTETAYADEENFDYPSSCFYRVKWHWSDSPTSGRWSDPEQLYKFKQLYVSDETDTFNYGYNILEARSNLRGNGRALSIRFYSESGKDFRLLGWAIPFTGVTSP